MHALQSVTSDNEVARGMHLEVKPARAQRELCHLITVRHRTHYLTGLSSRFIICSMPVIAPTFRDVCVGEIRQRWRSPECREVGKVQSLKGETALEGLLLPLLHKCYERTFFLQGYFQVPISRVTDTAPHTGVTSNLSSLCFNYRITTIHRRGGCLDCVTPCRNGTFTLHLFHNLPAPSPRRP